MAWFTWRIEIKSMWIRSTETFNTHWKNEESRNLALKKQQYQILKAKDTRALGTSLLIIPELCVLVLSKNHVGSGNEIAHLSFSSPEPTILLACGRNRELWEQPFQACAIDADHVRPGGQNSVISFVISKCLLPELSIPAAGH